MNIYDVLYSMNTGNATPNARPFDNLLGQALSGEGVITTATGNPISIVTNKAQNAISTLLSYSPKQRSGSGDPSPQNIRPIEGWTEANLGVNSETPTKTISLGGTYYGFSVDVERGVLRNTYGLIDMGSINWTRTNGTGHFYGGIDQSLFPYKFSDDTKMVCETYKFDGAGITGNYYGADGTVRYWYTRIPSNARELYVTDNAKWDTMTAEEFKQSVTGKYIAFELETPIELPLTPQTVALLAGNNTIWTDGDNIEITYKARG